MTKQVSGSSLFFFFHQGSCLFDSFLDNNKTKSNRFLQRKSNRNGIPARLNRNSEDAISRSMGNIQCHKHCIFYLWLTLSASFPVGMHLSRLSNLLLFLEFLTYLRALEKSRLPDSILRESTVSVSPICFPLNTSGKAHVGFELMQLGHLQPCL